MVQKNTVYNKNSNAEEITRIREQYERRDRLPKDLYCILNPSVYMSLQEKERALIKWIKWAGLEPVSNKKVLEIGCGSGGNLLDLIRLGFLPENLVGNELLEKRSSVAKEKLPAKTSIITGDAARLDLPNDSFDIVLQSTVFSSILDERFQIILANRILKLIKPGGGILWYDFVFNNPHNPDVKGIPPHKIRALFPKTDIKIWRLTLAPPISRIVTRIHPGCYPLLNAVPFLRTHVLCWIRKKDF